MSARSLRLTALATSLCVVIAGCAPGSEPSASSTALASPTFALSWAGSPGDESTNWAEDLDPESQYGLHRRKGLDPVLKPETMVLDAAGAALLTAADITNREECLADTDTHPTCRFALTFSSLPAGLRVGSVLNAGITPTTPTGLLVKVTGIDQNRVSAVQAGLPDALTQGEFWHEQAFSPELRAEPTLAPGVTVVARRHSGIRRSAPSGLPRFDQLSLPGELALDVEPVSGVHLTGTLDFGAGCGLDGGVGGSDVAWMEISCQAWESTALKVASTRDGAINKQEYPVGLFPLAAIPIPIGPLVVVVVVDILVTVDLSGQVRVGLHYSGHESAQVYGGLKFSIGHGLNHTGGVNTSAGGDGSGLKQDFSVTAVGRSQLRLSAYGVLGITIGGDASLAVAGGPSQDPRWRVLANAGIFIGMFLGIVGFELTARISYHLKHPFLVASGGNAKPTLIVVWPADGEVIRVGGLLPRKVEATAIDPEDGPLTVRWTDLADNVTVAGVGPQTLPFRKLGTHTLQASAVDADGAAVERVISVRVEAPSLSLSLHLLHVDGAAFDGSPSGSAGSALLADAVITSSQLASPTCAGLVWTATNAEVTSDGSCRGRVRLGQPGQATISASLTDQYGTAATASATTTVVSPPSTVSPEFVGIDATANGRHLAPGDLLLGAQPVQLTFTYLNRDQAKVTPRYSWSYRAGGAAQVALPGGTEVLTSTRSYTPPSPWGHTATFTVVIRDAATDATLGTRKFTVSWQSLPK